MARTLSSEFTGRVLPGKDPSVILGAGASAIHAVCHRDQVMLTFSGIAQTDAKLARVIGEGARPAKTCSATLTSLAPHAAVTHSASLNEQLNAVMEAEFGNDDGLELPEIASISWTLDLGRIEL